MSALARAAASDFFALADALLWALAYRQSRLPDPDGFLGAWLPVTLDPAGVKIDRDVAMEDLQPVRGNRRRIDLQIAVVVGAS